MRVLFSILVGAVLSHGTATAQGLPEQLCGGKYALAQEILDAAHGKYGTIYSGGPALEAAPP